MITNRLPEVATTGAPNAPANEAVPPTDGELLMRFTRHGDREAFAQVVERHRPMVWSVCSRVLVRHADAEDAYQATLLILAKRAGSIRANDSAGGWLFRVAHNAALQSRRRRKALRETPLEESPPAPEPLFPDIQQKQLVAALLEELRSLPQQYQTPLVLRYLEGRSRRQIATAMDVTVATVAGRLVRGRRMLRARLARRGVSFAAAMGAFGIGSASAAASAGTIHGAVPLFDPVTLSATVSSTTSAAVQQLVQQGVRTMLYASLTKPAVLGLAATLAAALLLVDPQNGSAQPAGQAPLQLDATVGAAMEPDESASILLAQKSKGQPIHQPKTRSRIPGSPIREPAAQRTEMVAKEMRLLTRGGEGSKPATMEIRSEIPIAMHSEGGKTFVRLTGKDGAKGMGVLQVTINEGEEKSFELQLGQLVELEKLTGVRIPAVRLNKQLSKPQESLASVFDRARFGELGLNRPESPPNPALPPAPPLPKTGPSNEAKRPLRSSLPSSRKRVAQRRPAFSTPAEADADLTERLSEIDALLIEIDSLRAQLQQRTKADAARYGMAAPTAPTATVLGRPDSAKPKSGPLLPGERVDVEVYDRFNDEHLLNEALAIDGDGYLALGARWGRLEVAGLTLNETEKAVKIQVQDVTDRIAAIRAEAGIEEDPKRVDLGVQVTRYERLMKQATLRETQSPAASVSQNLDRLIDNGLASSVRINQREVAPGKPLQIGDRIDWLVQSGIDGARPILSEPPTAISEAGTVALPLIGDLVVAGKTIAEATEAARKKLRDVMPDPQVRMRRSK